MKSHKSFDIKGHCASYIIQTRLRFSDPNYDNRVTVGFDTYLLSLRKDKNKTAKKNFL